MGLTAFSSCCSIIRALNLEVCVANSCLISNACTMILALQYFCGASTKIYIHEHLTHDTQKFPDLWYLLASW